MIGLMSKYCVIFSRALTKLKYHTIKLRQTFLRSSEYKNQQF